MKTTGKILLGLAVLGALTIATADGATLYKSCAGCHGVKGEKKALGKSMIIKGWKSNKIVKALQGYKDGTYGGPMKGVMKGQVVKLDNAKMKAIGDFLEAQK